MKRVIFFLILMTVSLATVEAKTHGFAPRRLVMPLRSSANGCNRLTLWIITL